MTRGQSCLKIPRRKRDNPSKNRKVGWVKGGGNNLMLGSSQHTAALVSPRCGGSHFALSLGGGEGGEGREWLFCGLTVLMQSSRSDLVSPLIISSACVFSSLAD